MTYDSGAFSMRPDVIVVRVKPAADGAFIAGSSDLRGLHVLAQTREKLIFEVSEAIEALYAARGKQVRAQHIPAPSERTLVWVAMPTDVELDQCA